MTDFVAPDKQHPRDRYRAEVVERKDNWGSCVVAVMDGDREITRYERNYSLMKTFEPFRQLRDGAWHDYALISTRYTRLEVMDLATGDVIATEPFPVITQEWQDSMTSYRKTDEEREKVRQDYPVGKEMPGEGFCPVEFYVPDWWDDQDGSVMPGDEFWEESDERCTGEFGVYCGCVWGDDSSWKIRHVDLSKISEGVVTTDERFGYIELSHGSNLRDAVRYWTETDRLEIAVSMHFDRQSGEAGQWYQKQINWGKKD